MANFQTHVIGAALVSGVGSLSLLVADIIPAQEALIYFSLGVIGGLLPDLDSDNSWPIRIAFNTSAIIFSCLLIFYLTARFDISIIELLLTWILSYYFIRFAIFEAFTKMTKHRGLLHSIPMTFLIGFITINITFYTTEYNQVTAWFMGLFLVIGMLTHLILDEIYAVDLLNRRLKRSFGTALKVWADTNHWGSFFTYIALILAWHRLPPAEGFLEIILSLDTYKKILINFLPSF